MSIVNTPFGAARTKAQQGDRWQGTDLADEPPEMQPQRRPAGLAHIVLCFTAVATVAMSISYSTGSVASTRGPAGLPGPTDLLSPSPSESPPPPPPQFPPTPERSKITIRFDDAAGAFKGAVSSKRAKCERRRRVLVKKERSGSDDLVGETRTGRSGRWTLDGFDNPRGRFYAVTPKKSVEANGATMVCGRARSRTIEPNS